MTSAFKPGSTKMCKRVTCYSTSGRLEAQDNSLGVRYLVKPNTGTFKDEQMEELDMRVLKT